MWIRLKDFRTTVRMQQRELGEVLGVTQSAVSRLEKVSPVEIIFPQYKALCERFGEEQVNEFCSETPPVSANNNVNENGFQNNGIYNGSEMALDIINKQTEALSQLASKQAEQTDRVLSLLEKMAERL